MMHHFADRDSGSRSYPVEVLRLIEAGEVYVRTLSSAYGGFMTHWVKGRSVYCRAAECEPSIHKTKRTWYGFCPVEAWRSDLNFWRPYVLQITEHLELDFRGRFARGQVWHLQRPKQTSSKKTAVLGRLVEEIDPSKLPSAFDIVPVLTHVFRELHFKLDTPNPMPPRSVMSPSLDPGPKILTEVDKGPGPAESEYIRSRLREKGFIAPGLNGKSTSH